MSALTIRELKKHNYLETFVNNFDNQNCYVLNNGKKFSFLKRDKTNKEFFNTLKKALKEGTGNNKGTESLQTAESIVKNGKQYAILKGRRGKRIKFSDISKFNVSGISSKISGAETAARLEGGVYLRLCEYLAQKPLVSSDSKVKKDLEIAEIGLTEKEIFEICDKQAKNIINKLKLKGKNYKILWREDEYKAIRDAGHKFFKELYSGAHADKWTPADIIIGSKAGIEKAINSKSLIEINKLFEIQNGGFGELNELIGISLKKGESEARLGAGGFDRIMSILSTDKVIKQKPDSYKNTDILFKEQKQFWKTTGKKLIQKVGIPVYFIVQKSFNDSKSKDFSKLQKSTKEGLQKTITNIRSQGTIIEFLEFLNSTTSDSQKIFDSIYKFCKSIFPLSANYVLEDGSSTLKVLGNESKSKTFKAKALYINMNGFGKMFIEYDNGTQIELRNKGTVQFEINTSQKYTNSVLANTFSF